MKKCCVKRLNVSSVITGYSIMGDMTGFLGMLLVLPLVDEIVVYIYTLTCYLWFIVNSYKIYLTN